MGRVCVPINGRRETPEAVVKHFRFHCYVSLSPLVVLAASYLFAKHVSDFVNPGQRYIGMMKLVNITE